MKEATARRYADRIKAAGIRAVLADKKVKLLAKVNHEDNFATHYARIAFDGMMEVICERIEAKDKRSRDMWSDWFNQAVATPARNPSRSCFDAIAITAAREAYRKLRPERSKLN